MSILKAWNRSDFSELLRDHKKGTLGITKSRTFPKGAWPCGPFLEGPEKFSHPKSNSKISNLMISELFYSQILNMNRGSLHTRSFRRIHVSVFRYRWTKNGSTGLKTFRDLRETGPWTPLKGTRFFGNQSPFILDLSLYSLRPKSEKTQVYQRIRTHHLYSSSWKRETIARFSTTYIPRSKR